MCVCVSMRALYRILQHANIFHSCVKVICGYLYHIFNMAVYSDIFVSELMLNICCPGRGV